MNIDIKELLKIAKAAGDEILKVYDSSFDVEYKEDKSPLTVADKNSHKKIAEGLKRLYPQIPLFSEEGSSVPYEERKKWEKFWLIDPMDGTKEFVNRNGEFTVNISLIHGELPVIGVVYVPVKDIFYFAQKTKGAYKLENCPDLESFKTYAKKIICRKSSDKLTVVSSRSHLSDETKKFVGKLEEKYKDVDMISCGSSLKLCVLAEGCADIYPRFAPTREWDISAGQIVVEEAGGFVVTVDGFKQLIYNKPNIVNPWFIATANLEYIK